MSRRSLPPCLPWVVVCAACVVSASAVRSQTISSSLIYTAVQPCRLFDTQLATNGTNHRLHPDQPQTFNVVGGDVSPATFTGQGGTAGGCAVPGFNLDFVPVSQAQAVVLELEAEHPGGGGEITAWPTGQPQPASSILRYTPEAALKLLVIVPLRQDLPGSDITVVARNSPTDLRGEVVGYFSNGNAVGFGDLFLGAGAGNPAVTTGMTNTALGYQSLAANIDGSGNTAVGVVALLRNSSGGFNTAVGRNAMEFNTTGGNNAAVGAIALFQNTTGSANTALGSGAMGQNRTGQTNTAAGQGALGNNTAGSDNTALGWAALGSSMGQDNIGVGALAGSQIVAGSSNIDIGNTAPGDESQTIRIGTPGTQTATYLAGVSGATSSGGTAVFVNGAGQLGTLTSSLRFKDQVLDMGEASAGLMELRPVTFRYRPDHDDGSHLLQYGLIAEEVAKVYPDLVQYDGGGRPLAVRYHFVDAMVLNEVQKQHRALDGQRASVADLQARVAAQQAEIARQQRQAGEQEERIARLEALLGLKQQVPPP